MLRCVVEVWLMVGRSGPGLNTTDQGRRGKDQTRGCACLKHFLLVPLFKLLVGKPDKLPQLAITLLSHAFSQETVAATSTLASV